MLDYEGSRNEFWHFMAEFGEEPAFLARARAPQLALDELLRRCVAQRDELLAGPRLHWSALVKQIGGDWSRLVPFLSGPDDIALLAELDTQLAPRKNLQPDWLATDKVLLRRFLTSAQRFNRIWTRWLEDLDLEEVNRPRRDYNQFYVLEKACAFLSERITDEFEPLDMIEVTYLEERFPLLTLPKLNG
jgi:hypothetical protein